jgi:glycosyl transferase family 25
METELKRVGVQGKFIRAVDGEAFGENCKQWLNSRSGDYRLSKGEAALILSHRKAWRGFLKSGETHCVVLEDDVHLGRGFADILHINWSSWPADVIKLETFRNKTWISKYKWFVAGRELRRLFSHHFGAAAYIVSATGAGKLLERTRAVSEPVDHSIFGKQAITKRRVVVLQLVPAIAIQEFQVADSHSTNKLPSSLTTTRGRSTVSFRDRKISLRNRLVREIGRLIEQLLDLSYRRCFMERKSIDFK